VNQTSDRAKQNFSLISEFITPMGRIKHSSDTGLRPVNQRKMAKAIRRAIAMGLHPSVHKHPEILRLSRHGAPTQAVPDRPDPSQNFL
jgi:small subunit ribosomal protein S18